MGELPTEAFTRLAKGFGETTARAVDGLVSESDSIFVDAHDLSKRLEVTEGVARDIAYILVDFGILRVCESKVCPKCGSVIPEESVTECSNCHTEIEDWNELAIAIFFDRSVPQSRDVGWLIAMHGMNSTGQWQQSLQWHVDLTFRNTVPFANWKYGRVRLEPLVGPLRHRLVRNFLSRVRTYSVQASDAGVGDRPDVIAHSFGTWLLGQALREDANLRIGQVILLGSILRPDFDWGALIERGQVESVLNHYGTRDRWSRLAVRVIPDSGPSGAIGFLAGHRNVHNLASAAGHSSLLAEDELPRAFNDAWRPFLRNRLAMVRGLKLDATCAHWSPPHGLLRAPAFVALGSVLIIGLVLSLAYAIARLT